MTYRACVLLMIGLVANTLRTPPALAQEIALAKPRFIATWVAPGASADASNVAVLQRRVSLDVSDVPLSVALRDIATQAWLDLSYDKSVLPPKRLVSLHAREITAAGALTEVLLNSGLDVAVGRTGELALVRRRPAVPVQEGTILGRVTDQSTAAPIEGVSAEVQGTAHRAVTRADGRYRIPGVPAGSYTLLARRIGYTAATQQVVVPASGEVTADFTLAAAILRLQEVVSTITGQQQRRELANAISQIDAASIVDQAPIANVSELLNARATGVTVLESSGTVGGGSRIRIRGSNSLSLANDPIVYVDGTRVNSLAQSDNIGFLVGGQGPSAINDLNPDEIESIEIVKGPSAATLYGTDAANGVIRVTTKRGQAGRAARWNAFAAVGLLKDRYQDRYPLNFGALDGTDPLTATPCYAFMVSQGLCQQQALLSYQPLNDPVVGPIAAGSQQHYGLSVAGGQDAFTYYLSGDWTDEVGPIELADSVRTALTEAHALFPWQTHPNDLRRLNLRANFGVQLPSGFHLNASTGYTTSNSRRVTNDDAGFGLLQTGLQGSFSPELGFGGHGFALLRPEEIFAIETPLELDRLTGSIQGNWQPPAAPWFSARATIGLDLTRQEETSFTPIGAFARFGPLVDIGSRIVNQSLTRDWTADVSATAGVNLTPAISSRSTLGTQYFHANRSFVVAAGNGLVPFTETVFQAATQRASEGSLGETATIGFFAEQQFGWRNRLFVTGGLRADDHSAFGRNFDVTLYPKFGASYVVVDDADPPRFGALNALRLRAAWGASGVSPGPTDAIRFFDPGSTNIGGIIQPGVSFGGGIGNAALKPERSREVEVGFDADLLDRRLGLEFTYYHKKTKDALVSRTLAPSVGISESRFENIGAVLNKGIEAALTAQVLRARNLIWDIRAAGSRNINRLVKLGEGIAPIIESEFTGQRHVEGFPLGGYWGLPTTFSDANGDGIIAPEELVRGADVAFLGNIFPKTELSLSSSVTLFDRLRVGVLFDHRGDFLKYNKTEESRCAAFLGVCRGLNDPSAPLLEQARAVDAFANGTSTLYIEDASFWKLRELSFTVFAPERWARALGAERLDLVLTGRNLATWTDYTGLDPEINAGSQSNFLQYESFTQPSFRTWLARINVGF